MVDNIIWHKRLLEQSRKLGINAKQLQHKSGCSYSAVSAALYGNSLLVKSVKKIAEALSLELKLQDVYGDFVELRQVYKRRKLTQRDLSRLTGLPTSSINNAIKGKSISTYTLEVIATALDLQIIFVSLKPKRNLPNKNDAAEQYSNLWDYKEAFKKGWEANNNTLKVVIRDWLEEQLLTDNLGGCKDYDSLINSLNNVFEENKL